MWKQVKKATSKTVEVVLAPVKWAAGLLKFKHKKKKKHEDKPVPVVVEAKPEAVVAAVAPAAEVVAEPVATPVAPEAEEAIASNSPGAVIANVIKKKEIAEARVKALLNLDDAGLADLMSNKLPIDDVLADKLQSLTDVPKRFWLHLQMAYDKRQ